MEEWYWSGQMWGGIAVLSVLLAVWLAMRRAKKGVRIPIKRSTVLFVAAIGLALSVFPISWLFPQLRGDTTMSTVIVLGTALGSLVLILMWLVQSLLVEKP